MKRLIILLVCVLLFLSPTTITYATENNKTLTFTMASDAPRTVDLLLYYALKELGYTPSISILGNTATLRMADIGERDGVAFQAKYIGDQFLDITMVEHFTLKMNLNAYVNTSSNLNIVTWDDLANLRVGMIYEKPYVETRVPKSAKLTMFSSAYQLFDELSKGNLDVAVVLKVSGQEFWSPGNIKFANTLEKLDVYTYLNKKHTDLAPKLSAVLEKMYADGTANKILNHEILGEPNEKKLILRVSTYNSDSPWDRKIGEELAKNGDYKIINIDLNVDKVKGVDESLRIYQNLIRSDLIGKSPDVIVVSDNEALEFIKNSYLPLFNKVPVVFCGINNYSNEIINGFEQHFTGVTENISANETVEVMLKLFPKTKKIFVINDFSESGRAWKNEINSQIEGEFPGVTIQHNENIPLIELVNQVKNLPLDTLILSGSYMVNKQSQSFSEEDVQRFLYQNSPVPIFGLKSTTFGFGQLGGKFVGSEPQGKLAASLVSSVFNDPTSIPSVITDTSKENKWRFDSEVMEKYSITKKQIDLVEAEFIHEFVPLHKSNPTLFIAAISFISLLLILVLIFVVLSISKSRHNKKLSILQESLYSTEELLEKDNTVKNLKEYFERLIDTSPIGYVLIAEDRVVEFNKYITQYFNIHKGDTCINDVPINQFLSEAALTSIKYFKTITDESKRFYLGSTTVEYNKKDATILWYLDIEEYEKQNDMLNQLQSELEKILATLPIALVITNAHTNQIKFCNSLFLDLFQLPSLEEAEKISMNLFLPTIQLDLDENEEDVEETDKIVKTKKCECQYTLPNGEKIDSLLITTPFLYQEEECNIEVIVDIADDKKRDSMLENMADKEREANKLKSRFIVNMSHEIRTPMNAIIGLSELHLLNAKNRETSEAIKKINHSAKTLLSIINDILDFSKLEAEKFQMQEAEFYLDELVSEIMSIASQQVMKKPIEIYSTVANKIPNSLIGDKNRLSQMLKNIVDNAIKFTNKGHVAIDVSISEIHSPNEFNIMFCVEDTGIGMAENEVAKIFLPFEQFNNTNRNQQGGTGLGISIVKQLVDLMKGSIAISSEIGCGTKVTIELPIRSDLSIKEADTTVRRIDCVKSTFEVGEFKQFENARILLCEDNAINQTVALGILELFGTSARIVNNGKEALDLLDMMVFDLILMDINMPLMDGYETTIAIRSSGHHYKNIPIIAMTGNSLDDEIKKCMEIGMNAHVVKPINIDVLYHEIQKFLQE